MKTSSRADTKLKLPGNEKTKGQKSERLNELILECWLQREKEGEEY